MSEKDLEQLIRAERNAYSREWRAKNKDRIKQHNADYWKRRVLKTLEAQKEAEQEAAEVQNG